MEFPDVLSRTNILTFEIIVKKGGKWKIIWKLRGKENMVTARAKGKIKVLTKESYKLSRSKLREFSFLFQVLSAKTLIKKF